MGFDCLPTLIWRVCIRKRRRGATPTLRFPDDAVRVWTNLDRWNGVPMSSTLPAITDMTTLTIRQLADGHFMIKSGDAFPERYGMMGDRVHASCAITADPVELAHFLLLSPNGRLLRDLLDAFPASVRTVEARRLLDD